MKKALSLLSALALVGTLAACDSDDDSFIPRDLQGVTAVASASPVSQATGASDNSTDAANSRAGITKIEGGEIVPRTGGDSATATSMQGNGVVFSYLRPFGWTDLPANQAVLVEFGIMHLGTSKPTSTTNIVVAKSIAQDVSIDTWNDDYGYTMSKAFGIVEFTKYTSGGQVYYEVHRNVGGIAMTQTIGLLIKDGVVYEVGLTTTPDAVDELRADFAEFMHSLG